MKTPVVGTNVGGVPEEVINGETGFIVPVKNPHATAEAVINLLRNPKKINLMGQKAKERVDEIFSLERCVERHKKVYESVR